MTAEHHGGMGGYLPNPLQAAGWALETMKHGWAAACPLLLPLRPTALAIEETAWLAARFPGRVGLGVGAGALELDFQIMDQVMDGYKQRFLAALPEVSRILGGGDAGQLARDPAVRRLADHPVPVVSAASTPGGCRHAAAAGAGLLVDGAIAHIRTLVGVYRDAGGTGPLILIRRVWLGDPTIFEKRQASQLEFYRSYVGKEAVAKYASEPYIGGTPMAAAEKLAESLQASGAYALNIRLHTPGVTPEDVHEQIDAFGEVMALLRHGGALPT
jgi:alkanesulfonate monooxygenase SsuD/methylene tetrahydromethanopterin reductase-like flavin-dependent oxidoreductase (luciferase family)